MKKMNWKIVDKAVGGIFIVLLALYLTHWRLEIAIPLLYACWLLYLFLNKLQRSIPKSDLVAIQYLVFNLNKLILDKDIPPEFKDRFLKYFEKGEIPYVSIRIEYHLGGLVRIKIDYSYGNGENKSLEYDDYVSYLYGNHYKDSIFLSLSLGKKINEEPYEEYDLVVRRKWDSLCVSIGYYSMMPDRSHWMNIKDLYKLDLSRANMEKYYKSTDKAKVYDHYGYDAEIRNYSNGKSMDYPWSDSVDCLNWRITTVDYNKRTFTRRL